MPTGFKRLKRRAGGGGGSGDDPDVQLYPPTEHPDRQRVNLWVGGSNVTSTVHYGNHTHCYLWLCCKLENITHASENCVSLIRVTNTRMSKLPQSASSPRAA